VEAETRVPAWPGGFQFVDFDEYNWTNIRHRLEDFTEQRESLRSAVAHFPSDDETASNRDHVRWNALSGCTFNSYTFGFAAPLMSSTAPATASLTLAKATPAPPEQSAGATIKNSGGASEQPTRSPGGGLGYRRFRIHIGISAAAASSWIRRHAGHLAQ
jgi:hypothetical protein